MGVIGAAADLTYKYDYLGAGAETLAKAWDRPPDRTAKP